MRTRVVASVILAAIVLLGTSACNFISPQATLKQYDPSDGVSASIGDIKVLNAIVLTEDGTDATLLASLVNQGPERVQLTLQYETESGDVEENFSIAGGATMLIGAAGETQVILEGIDTNPGELFPVFVQYGENTGKQLMVPVLDGTLAEYGDLLP